MQPDLSLAPGEFKMSTYLSLARLSIVTVSLAAASTLIHAAPTVFFGENQVPDPAYTVSGAPLAARTSFLSHLVGVGTETFENRDVNSTEPLAILFPGSGGNITATITGDGVVAATSDPQADDSGRYNTTGATGATPSSGRWWDTSSTFTIDFSSAISAFGFYGTDMGDFNGQVTVALWDGIEGHAPTELIIDSTINSSNGSLLFWGFYDTAKAYTRISFGNTNAYTDYFGFDDMVVGDLGQIKRVPEPATLMLTSLGLLGLAATRRKQSH